MKNKLFWFMVSLPLFSEVLHQSVSYWIKLVVIVHGICAYHGVHISLSPFKEQQ